MSRATKSKPFKACANCRALVPRDAAACPVCGSNKFTDEWSGVIIILEPGASRAANILGYKNRGRYAIKIE